MSVIVTDEGFVPDDWPDHAVPLEAFDAEPDMIPDALDLPADTEPEALEGRLEGVRFIRIDIPGFADGRGFTLARQLRGMGYSGRLRASGPLISDQYGMARRCGFDEVEIPEALAARQPEADWRARADWRAASYQSKLRAESPRPTP